MLENYALSPAQQQKQLVDAPVHFPHVVLTCLNINLPDEWIGKGRPTA
jgi:hypothetical protein